ncbi:MAG: hypothetical protein V4487_03525 [Chlamydiota bacterium]
MCISVFYAQVFGCYIFLISLAMLLHQNRFKRMMTDFLTNHPLVSLSGAISLLIGLVVVITHDVWVAQWPVVITLIGWIAILQGIMRIFFPETFGKWMKQLAAKNGYTVWCWIWLLVGLYLLWSGFNTNAGWQC